MSFICHSLRVSVMLQGLSDALKTAADIVAPPTSLIQDLEYHWKQVKTFYNNQNNVTCHISKTSVPHHLESMLQILLKEDEIETNKTSKFCLEFVLNNRPLDLLIQLSIADSPPGIKVCVLNWVRRFLSCTKSPPLEHTSIFEPLRNLIKICNGKVPSPYELEEILFLETIAGLIRQNPNLINFFLPSHQYSAKISSKIKTNKIKKFPESNSLFQNTQLEANIRRVEIVPNVHEQNCLKLNTSKNSILIETNCDINDPNNDIIDEMNSKKIECDCEANERYELFDIILSYFESPDSEVVVRSCEGALILASIPYTNTKCTSIERSLKDFTDYLIKKICTLYEKIPEDMDADNIEEGNISWGFAPKEPDNNRFIGKSEFHEFFCWLDYTDCLAFENFCSPIFITQFRNEFLLKYVEPTLLATDTPFVLILLSKIVRQIRSSNFMDEIANWLVGETNTEPYSATDCLLTIIIENMQDNAEILLAGLQFIEALLDNPNEQILNEMIFRYLNKRGYYDNNQSNQTWSDEEEERERKCGSIEDQFRSYTLSPHNILKVINHFLLLLPRQIMTEASGTCYEDYVQDASKHYKLWIKKTEKFSWPREAISQEREIITLSSSIGNLVHPKIYQKRSVSLENEIHCNDSGISEGRFYEGPLLKLLFSHVRCMSTQSCEINLAIIAIISKLAFLPHPYLHEILLNPVIPVAVGATNLWFNMQTVAKFLLLEIPKHEHFQKRIGETGRRLLSNPPVICDEGNDDIEQYYEAIVILEEFCKELAAIAFVKFHHATKE